MIAATLSDHNPILHHPRLPIPLLTPTPANPSHLLFNAPLKRWHPATIKGSAITVMRSGAPLIGVRATSSSSLQTPLNHLTTLLPFPPPPSSQTLTPYRNRRNHQPAPTSAFMPWLVSPRRTPFGSLVQYATCASQSWSTMTIHTTLFNRGWLSFLTSRR